MNQRRFYAAKINIHGNIFSDNVDTLIKIHIPHAIMESEPVQVNSFTWSFTDREIVNVDGTMFIVGNVTKSKIINQTYRIGTKTTQMPTEHELAMTAFFVYQPEAEIIIHESKSGISPEAFRTLFESLLSRDIHIGEVKVLSITDPFVLRDELNLFDRITSISFNIIHPNPGKKEFDIYQKIIHENRVRELDIKMRNRDGLAVHTSDGAINQTIDSGIQLIETGYGDLHIAGYTVSNHKNSRGRITERKRKKKFSSREHTRHIVTDETDQKSLISRLVKFMMDVKLKTKNGRDDDRPPEQNR